METGRHPRSLDPGAGQRRPGRVRHPIGRVRAIGLAGLLPLAGALTPGPPRSAAAPASAPLSPARPDPAREAVFARFLDWVESAGRSAPLAPDPADLDAVRTLARERHEEMTALIRRDPRRAIELALPEPVRAELPHDIASLVEERVCGIGDLAVLAATSLPGTAGKVEPWTRTVTLHGREYRAFVFGRRLDASSQFGVPLCGIALDDLCAVDENPLCRLSLTDPRAERAGPCPVCALPRRSAAAPVLTAWGGQAAWACCEEHALAWNAQLIEREEGSVGTRGAMAASPYTTGEKRLILIRVDFDDRAGAPFADATGPNLIADIDEVFRRESQDQLSFLPAGGGSAVTPTYRMPQTAEYYGTDGSAGRLRTDAREAAEQDGFDLDEFDFDMICHGTVPGWSWAGLGMVGAPGAWIQNSFSRGVMVHELGHNLGLGHANFWDTQGESIIGQGESVEYGDRFDIMGSGSSGWGFSAYFKNFLDWIPDSGVRTVSRSGVYQLRAHDVPGAAGVRLLSITKSGTTWRYWLEYRQGQQGNPWFSNAAVVRWTRNSTRQTDLLDASVGSASGKDDAPLRAGDTFTDSERAVHITPLGTLDGDPNTLSVQVSFGQPAGNRAPRITLEATPDGTEQGFTFRAAAVDDDGDALSYFWDFGDATPSSDTAEVAHEWTRDGEYVVRCTVSDRRGGRGTDALLVRLGAARQPRIEGRVATAEGPLDGVRVFVSATRSTYTDRQGLFRLAGLAEGSYNVRAARDGFAFLHPAFANPVAAAPGTDGVDLVAIAASGMEPAVLLAAGSVWRFLDDGSEPPSQWTSPEFDDGAWKSGRARLGYGDDGEITRVGYGPDATNKFITTYFRSRFAVAEPARLVTLTARLARDDGAIVYLNGTEVVRSNMPDGSVTGATEADEAIGGAEESQFEEWSIPVDALQQDDNVLAVEVHQAAPDSSDLGFDLELVARGLPWPPAGVFISAPASGTQLQAPAAVPVTVAAATGSAEPVARIVLFAGDQALAESPGPSLAWQWTGVGPGAYRLRAEAVGAAGTQLASAPIRVMVTEPVLSAGSVWRFWDRGSLPAADWMVPAYSDAGWRSGPARLGYGSDGEVTRVGYGPSSGAKYMTTYFRHAFTLPAGAAAQRIQLRLQCDDGAVVYVNGAEAYRRNMPSGPVSFPTPAAAVVDGDGEQAWSAAQLGPGWLVEGTNVIAAEVHQISPSSSDIGFDLAVDSLGSGAGDAPPPLALQPAGAWLLLSWPRQPGFWDLLRADALGDAAAWERAPEPLLEIGPAAAVYTSPRGGQGFFLLDER